MKRLSLLGALLCVSTCIGMNQDTMETTIQELVMSLKALEKALTVSVVPAVPSAPVIPQAPVDPVKPVKVKDPIKQAIAQFLGSLSPEQRADFDNLTPDERNERLAQIFTGGAQKQPQPGIPTQVGAGDEAEPENPPFVIPPAPGGPLLPPPPPPLIPVSGIGKIKPVTPKVTKPTLPILTQDELAAKSTEDKNRSDALFLQLLADISVTEFTKLSDFENVLRARFTMLRNEEQFLKRAQLDQLLDAQTGLSAQLKKEFTVDVGAKSARLLELYETFSQVKASMFFQSLVPLLSACLFDAQKLTSTELELLSVSYIVAQRGAQQSKGEVGREAREKSDMVFINAWKKVTGVQDGINDVVRSLNFVRIHPEFLLYQNMLWAGAEGSIERRLQSQDPLKGTLPLLVVLKSPQQFKLTFAVVSTTIKSHLFNIELYENNVNNQLVKEAYEWQVKNSKTVELISLKDYVLGRLKGIKSLSQLRSLLNQVSIKYPEQTTGLQNELRGSIAQLEATNPKIDVNIIAGALQGLLQQDIPADAKQSIENLISAATKDRSLIASVLDALKVKDNFAQQLIAQLTTNGNTELVQAIEKALTNIYRTPRDVYDILVSQLADKTALSDYQVQITQRIKPYGILLGAFKYYVEQYKRNPESIEQLKNNLGMLMKSINVIAHPTAQLGTGKSAAEEIAAKLPGIRAQLSSGKELVGLPYAPQLFDIAVDDNLIGKERAGYYTSQLTKNDPYKGLGLDGLLNTIKQDKNPQRVVEFLTELVKNAQGVSIDSPAFEELMTGIEQALQATYDKGINPEYIE